MRKSSTALGLAFAMLASLLPCASAAEAPGATAARRLVFPADHAVGVLLIRKQHTPNALDLSHRDHLNGHDDPTWTTRVEAKGTVSLPAGSEAMLRVSRESAADLTFLDALKPDDLYGLIFQITSEVGDAGVPHIARLTGLRELYCNGGFNEGGEISVQGARPLGSLVALRVLDLSWLASDPKDRVRNDRLSFLSRLAALRELNLSGVPVGPADLSALGKLTTLEALMLGDTVSSGVLTFGDEDLRQLRDLTKLKTLHLYAATAPYAKTRITGEGLRFLTCENSLHELNLWSAPVTGEGVAQLARFRNLEDVNLWGAHATGRAMVAALAKTRVRALKVGGGAERGLKDADIRAIAEGLPQLTSLDIDRLTELTDAGLEPLARMPHLRQLRLMLLFVSDAAVDKLKKDLPDCKVEFKPAPGRPVATTK